MSRSSSEVLPLDPQIAQRVVLLSGRSQGERGPRRTDFRSIGIDAEAIIQPGTTAEIDELCMSERERSLRDSVEIDHQTFSSLCFSAKESFFKCLYPLTGVWFDFQDAEIASFNPNLQILQMRLLRDLDSGFRQGQVFGGTFRWTDLRIYTAFALPSQ